MRIGRWQVKRRVLASAVGGVLVVLAWLVWTQRMRPPAGAGARPPQPFVQVAGGAGGRTTDRVLQERADYFDPTPLFYPTDKNFEQRELPATVRRQPGEVFGTFPPRLNLVEQKTWGAAGVQAPEKAADVLAQGVQAPFAGFGQVEAQRPPLPERSAFVEVTALTDGKPVVSQPISAGIRPPRRDFPPMEFIATVDAAGLVGDLVLTPGSEWEGVDNFFQDYLVKVFRIGLRLQPGTYRVLVGP